MSSELRFRLVPEEPPRILANPPIPVARAAPPINLRKKLYGVWDTNADEVIAYFNTMDDALVFIEMKGRREDPKRWRAGDYEIDRGPQTADDMEFDAEMALGYDD